MDGTSSDFAGSEGRPDQQDLADQDKAFECAERLDAMSGLARWAAHAFNNVLTVVTGYSELLLLELPKDDPRRVEVEEIHRAGKRGCFFTQRLLALGQRQALKPQMLDLNALVRDVVARLGALKQEQVSVSIDCEERLPRVLADPEQIRAAVTEIALMASEGMEQGGELRFETRRGAALENLAAPGSTDASRNGPGVALRVIDSGPGLDEASVRRVFEQLTSARENRGELGLGMAAVYGIVKQSGGEISVTSEIGRGTTVSLWFPAADVQRESKDSGVEATRGEIKVAPVILVVDDEPEVLRVAERMLLRSGFQVQTCSSGEEALGVLKSGAAVDLLLTDILMPGMAGYALAARASALRPGLRVLYMSGGTDQSVPGEWENAARQYECLQKPFSFAELGQKIKNVLAGTSLRDRIESTPTASDSRAAPGRGSFRISSQKHAA